MATEKLVIGQLPPLYSVLHLFIVGCTLIVYNLHYVIKKSSVELSDQYAWVQDNKYWNYTFILFGALLDLYCINKMPLIIWQTCIVLALFSFAYSLPLLPFKGKHRLKDIGWLKIFVLASVWTSVTAILPILYWKMPLSQYPFEIVLRYVFLFILCLAFDIRDKQVDLEAGIYTLPNKIGLLATYSLISSLAVLFIVLSIVQFFRFGIATRLVINVASTVTTLIAVHFVRKHPSDKNYILLIDGQMLLNGLMILLL
jgi:hypothetical protein